MAQTVGNVTAGKPAVGERSTEQRKALQLLQMQPPHLQKLSKHLDTAARTAWSIPIPLPQQI